MPLPAFFNPIVNAPKPQKIVAGVMGLAIIVGCRTCHAAANHRVDQSSGLQRCSGSGGETASWDDRESSSRGRGAGGAPDAIKDRCVRASEARATSRCPTGCGLGLACRCSARTVTRKRSHRDPDRDHRGRGYHRWRVPRKGWPVPGAVRSPREDTPGPGRSRQADLNHGDVHVGQSAPARNRSRWSQLAHHRPSVALSWPGVATVLGACATAAPPRLCSLETARPSGTQPARSRRPRSSLAGSEDTFRSTKRTEARSLRDLQ